jgi:exodeoxyribonuclease VIII
MTLQDLNDRPLSYSSLKQFAISPKHFINYRNKPKETTPALTYGQALHCMLLEPSEFNNSFTIMPSVDKRTKEGKEIFAKFEAEAAGKTILDEKLHTELFSLVEYIKTNPEWETLMSGAQTEVEDRVEIFGLPFITIKDIVKANGVVDVKSVQSGQIDNLIKDFYNYQYHLQAAIYTQQGESFAFYVVEKSDPYYNGLIKVSDDFISYGKKELERLCTAFNYCLEHPECFNMSYDFWYQFDGIKPVINLPYWVKNND